MVAVIGDIHGCIRTLESLYKKVTDKYTNIKIYSVGDLIDRGKFGCDVIKFISSEKINFVIGNHELMFMKYFENFEDPIGRAWIYNGMLSTLDSYTGQMDLIDAHIQFLKTAPSYFDLADCFISHAGISIYFEEKYNLPPKNKDKFFNSVCEDIDSEHSIYWTRERLLNLNKLQIVGHTRQKDVSFYKKSNALYIDTSVYTFNKLSAVIIQDNQLVDTIQQPSVDSDLI